MNSQTRNLAGIASLVAGVMIFSTQDAIIKALSGDHAVTLAIVLRSIVALPILLGMVLFETGLKGLLSRNLPLLIFRGFILLGSYTSYYLALPALPLAEAIALFFVAPIFVTILSAVFLGEEVRPAAWFVVFLGFCGVLIILRPGSELFEPAALLSLVSAATYALSMVIVRKMGDSESSSVIAFYTNAVYLVGAAAMAGFFSLFHFTEPLHPSLEFLVRAWHMPNTRDLLLMGACGVIAAVAMTLLTHAYRLAQANLVTIFEYTGMIWGPVWGYLFFAETPRWTTYAGMLLIMLSGVAAFLAASSKNKGEAAQSAKETAAS